MEKFTKIEMRARSPQSDGSGISSVVEPEFSVEALLDYYSVVLYDCRLDRFFERFGYGHNESILEFLMTARDTVSMQLRYVTLELPIGRLDIPLSEIHHTGAELAQYGSVLLDPDYGISPDEDLEAAALSFRKILETPLERVRFCCAGKDLENMRILGIFPEEVFTDLNFWTSEHDCLYSPYRNFEPDLDEPSAYVPEDNFFRTSAVCDQFKVTRADFTFDIVDHPELDDAFVEKLLREFFASKAEGNVRLFNGKPGGLSYSMEYGKSVQLLYIGKGEKGVDRGGSTGTGEFIRIYNKKQQVCKEFYKCQDSSLWPEDALHRGCKSWIRVELQARNRYASDKMFTVEKDATVEDKFLHIMDYLKKKFLVAPKRGESVFPALQKLFDVGIVNRLHFIQFADNIRYTLRNTADAKVQSWRQRNKVDIMVMISDMGWAGFVSWLMSEFSQMRYGTDILDVLTERRFRKRISELAICRNVNLEDFPGLDLHRDVNNQLSYVLADPLYSLSFAAAFSEKPPVPPRDKPLELEQIVLDFEEAKADE